MHRSLLLPSRRNLYHGRVLQLNKESGTVLLFLFRHLFSFRHAILSEGWLMQYYSSLLLPALGTLVNIFNRRVCRCLTKGVSLYFASHSAFRISGMWHVQRGSLFDEPRMSVLPLACNPWWYSLWTSAMVQQRSSRFLILYARYFFLFKACSTFRGVT